MKMIQIIRIFLQIDVFPLIEELQGFVHTANDCQVLFLGVWGFVKPKVFLPSPRHLMVVLRFISPL